MHEKKYCSHCRRRKICKPRGLCYACYYTPAVRGQYGSTHKSAYRGRGLGNGGFKLPSRPTSAPPGSAEKVAVLEERVREGLWLWHPRDAAACA